MSTCRTEAVSIRPENYPQVVDDITDSMRHIGATTSVSPRFKDMYTFTFGKTGDGKDIEEQQIRDRWKTISLKYGFTEILTCT